MRRWLPCLVLLSLGCTSAEPEARGRERMGTFDFTAQVVKRSDGGLDPAYQDCLARNITEVPTEDFTFQATFSRDPDTRETWINIGGISRKAIFDGQYVDTLFGASRQFQAFDGGGQLAETLHVALLSRSQSLALGGGCPADALDGGVPGADADGGVTLPGSIPGGFDALRACGVLVDVVEPPPDCRGCSAGCTLRYPVTGVRK